MRDPEIERVAAFLASQAVWLLGVGIVTAIGALAAIVAAVRTAAGFRRRLPDGLTALARHRRRIAVLDPGFARAGAFISRGYLVLQLSLGLAVTSAASVFFVIAEDVAAGGTIAVFDVAFARALRDTAAPAWERFFSVV